MVDVNFYYATRFARELSNAFDLPMLSHDDHGRAMKSGSPAVYFDTLNEKGIARDLAKFWRSFGNNSVYWADTERNFRIQLDRDGLVHVYLGIGRFPDEVGLELIHNGLGFRVGRSNWKTLLEHPEHLDWMYDLMKVAEAPMLSGSWYRLAEENKHIVALAEYYKKHQDFEAAKDAFAQLTLHPWSQQ